MILSHNMASSCSNMSPYQAIWIHFKPNSTIQIKQCLLLGPGPGPGPQVQALVLDQVQAYPGPGPKLWTSERRAGRGVAWAGWAGAGRAGSLAGGAGRAGRL